MDTTTGMDENQMYSGGDFDDHEEEGIEDRDWDEENKHIKDLALDKEGYDYVEE